MVLAAAAMTLVQEGRLDLHIPITTYLPWFTLAPGFDANSVTLEHLLTHTSGFPGDTLLACQKDTSGPRAEWFATRRQPLWSAPGELYNYSNFGYSLASVVVTAAAGVEDARYEQLIQDRVFSPLGIFATFDSVATETGDYATGHVLDWRGNLLGIVQPHELDCPLLRPFGGLSATASDYAHIMELLMARRLDILFASSVIAMEGPHVDMHTFRSQSYGYGLIVQNYPYPQHSFLMHDGVQDGYLAELAMVPDIGFGVVVLTNATGNGPVTNLIVDDALHRFISNERRTPVTETSSATWPPYQGRYEDTVGELGAVSISLESIPSHRLPLLVIDAPVAQDAFGSPAPIHGAMWQIALDEWEMPDKTLATFLRDNSDVPTTIVTRRGIAHRR
jgi:CubicO group peptidase (beta-lactamase class C family)